MDWKIDVDSGGEEESAIQPIIYLRHLLKKEKALFRKLIEASEEAGLTLFASEFENRFSLKESGSEENVPDALSAGLTPVICEIEERFVDDETLV